MVELHHLTNQSAKKITESKEIEMSDLWKLLIVLTVLQRLSHIYIQRYASTVTGGTTWE